MAKAQVAARFVTEVAPPQLVSVMRRRKVTRSLDTIAEDDDRELQQQLAYSDHRHQAATAAASLKRASPAGARTGGFMRELSSCFSSNVVHGQAAGGGWEGIRHSGHGRRVVYAHQLHGN
jgi:hypothetical protein